MLNSLLERCSSRPMRRQFWQSPFFLLLLLPLICGSWVALSHGVETGEPTKPNSRGTLPGTLIWNNDDRLAGELLRIEDDHVVWESALFDAPHEVHTDYLESAAFRVEKAASESPRHNEAFRLETSLGDVLFGKLESIDDEAVVLRSARMGRMRLRRDSVREIRQLQHTKVVYDGPRWLDGWKVLKAGRRVYEWKATEHGHLQTSRYGGELYHELPELEHAEINLVLRWSKRPGFQIDFSSRGELLSSRPKPRLSLKSWGDDVVAQSSLDASDFQPLLKLTERQETLRLRLVWDSVAGEVLIHGAGRQLGRIAVETKSRTPGFGVLIKNRSDDLTLEQIRVSKWNGVTKSEDRKAGSGYVRMADGELITESSVKLEAGDSELQVNDDRKVQLDQVAVMEFVPTATASVSPMHAQFADGTEISGRLLSLLDGQLTIATPTSETPLTAQVDQLSSLHFFEGKSSEYDFHLHFGDLPKLSGNLAQVSDASRVGWKSVGARTAVSPIEKSDFRVERRAANLVPIDRVASEIVYLRDGSLLIGSVDRINDQFLEVETSYSEVEKLPLSKVRAVEMLNGSGRVSFSSKDWDFSRGEDPLQRSHEQLEVSNPVSFRDLKLHHGGKVSFSCAWDEEFVGLLTLHMGNSTKQPRGSIARFTFSHERMSARCLLASTGSRTLPSIPDRKATVSVVAKDKRVRIWVNGILAVDTRVRTPIDHRGLWIQCGSARGQLANNNDKKNDPSRLVLDRLRVGDNANRIGVSFDSDEQLEMLLKLPRNRKDDAPESVLCSANGDLLRGHLIGLSEQQVVFESRGARVAMPRNEVAGVVWLQQPGEGAGEAVAAPDRTHVSLSDGSMYTLEQTAVLGEMLVGQHPVLKNCRFPLSKLIKLNMGGDAASTAIAAVVDWKLEATPEPKFAKDGFEQGVDSPLLGVDVSEVVVPMLSGGQRTLGEFRNKVVVLNFWTTWSAPCIRLMPRMIAMVDSFPHGVVELIAINQEESAFDINTFLSSRDLDVQVGLDPNAALSQHFKVAAVPHSVVIGSDGKVNRVFVGAPNGLNAAIAKVIEELMQPTD